MSYYEAPPSKGTVTISIEEFDELRRCKERAESQERLAWITYENGEKSARAALKEELTTLLTGVWPNALQLQDPRISARFPPT